MKLLTALPTLGLLDGGGGGIELFFPLWKNCGTAKEMSSFNGPGWLEAMTWAVPLWPCFYLSASQSVLKPIVS